MLVGCAVITFVVVVGRRRSGTALTHRVVTEYGQKTASHTRVGTGAAWAAGLGAVNPMNALQQTQREAAE